MKKPVVLCIMDGFGIRNCDEGNAIKFAKTPNLDKFFSENPFTTIGASGLDVGLPDGQMGNSEVGHTNIGAGRVVYQMLVKISKSIKDGDFFNIPALIPLWKAVRKRAQLFTLWVFFPTAVFTVTSSTFSVFSRWLRITALRRFTFIALWTAEMFLLLQVRAS